MLHNLDIPPGVVADGQPYEIGARKRWHRSNLVRWRNGILQPVGGWLEIGGVQINVSDGPPRGAFAWRDNSLSRYLAMGTPSGLFVHSDFDSLLDITPDGLDVGRQDSIYGAGFGFGPFGAEAFGTVRTNMGSLLDASAWSLDAWGENLIALMNSDGLVYEWTPGTPKALPVANAPSGAALLVTAERHLVVLGSNQNGRQVAWSDREDNTVWAAASTNLAGDFELRTEGRLVTGVRMKGENLILTSRDAWTMTFVGAPFVYAFDLLGRACGVFSAMAAVSAGSFAAWMGPAGWHVYDGALRNLPSDVHDYVYSDINLEQASKVVGGLNDQYGEIWWIYPSAAANEPNRYVIWNYNEDHWAIGELERTSWVPDGVFTRPILTGTDGKVYMHENGYNANGTPLNEARFVEGGAQSLGVGDQVSVVLKMLPDERTLGQTRVRFSSRFAPNGPATEHGPYDMSAMTDLRFQGRQVSLRIEGAADAAWRVGLPRLDVVPGGER